MPPAQVSGPQPGEPSTWTRSVTRRTDRRPAPWATGPAPAGPALGDSSRVTFIAVLRRSRQRCCWDGSAVAPQLLLCRRLLAPGEGLPGLRAMAVLQELYYEPGGRASRVLPQCTQCVGGLPEVGVAGGDKWPSLGSTVSLRTEGGSDRLQAQQRRAGTPSGSGAEPQLRASG